MHTAGPYVHAHSSQQKRFTVAKCGLRYAKTIFKLLSFRYHHNLATSRLNAPRRHEACPAAYVVQAASYGFLHHMLLLNITLPVRCTSYNAKFKQCSIEYALENGNRVARRQFSYEIWCEQTNYPGPAQTRMCDLVDKANKKTGCGRHARLSELDDLLDMRVFSSHPRTQRSSARFYNRCVFTLVQSVWIFPENCICRRECVLYTGKCSIYTPKQAWGHVFSNVSFTTEVLVFTLNKC